MITPEQLDELKSLQIAIHDADFAFYQSFGHLCDIDGHPDFESEKLKDALKICDALEKTTADVRAAVGGIPERHQHIFYPTGEERLVMA